MVFISIVLAGFSAVAQNTGLHWDNLNTGSNRLQGKIMGETYYVTSEANNYYFLHYDWLPGTLKMVDGDEYDDLFLRLDAYNDELVAYNNRIRALFVLEKELVKEFDITEGEKTMTFIKHFDDERGKSRYFEELYSGSVELLVFHHVDEVKVSPYKDRLGVLRDTEFHLNKDYFIYSPENGFRKIKLNRRSFYKAFPENKREIKKNFRKNKVVTVEEYFVVQVVRWLDEAGLLN